MFVCQLKYITPGVLEQSYIVIQPSKFIILVLSSKFHWYGQPLIRYEVAMAITKASFPYYSNNDYLLFWLPWQLLSCPMATFRLRVLVKLCKERTIMLILNFEGCMTNFALTPLLHSWGAVFKLAREHPFFTVDITKCCYTRRR